MLKKRVLFVIGLVIIILTGVILGSYLLIKKDDQYFLHRLDSINKMTFKTMSNVIALTEQDSIQLKKVIIDRFKSGKYQREKGQSLRTIPVALWVRMENETLVIGYSPETRQLFFESLWFIPPTLNQNEVGEYAFKTKDMFLTVGDEIENLLIKYNLNID